MTGSNDEGGFPNLRNRIQQVNFLEHGLAKDARINRAHIEGMQKGNDQQTIMHTTERHTMKRPIICTE